MPDTKPLAVIVTSVSAPTMSRHSLLQWINCVVNGEYKKIEELCSGVAYCQIMELLFPNCIGVKKIRTSAKLEHEYVNNLKLLQTAFNKLKFDKTVPIDKLIRGKFQDNFEFLQWFKKFFDTCGGEKTLLQTTFTSSADDQKAKKSITKPNSAPTSCKTTPIPASKICAISKTPNSFLSSKCSNKPKTGQTHAGTLNPVSPTSVQVLRSTYLQLSGDMMSLENERNWYYKKLKNIEQLLHECKHSSENAKLCNRAFKILYEGNDDALSVETSQPNFLQSNS